MKAAAAVNARRSQPGPITVTVVGTPDPELVADALAPLLVASLEREQADKPAESEK